MQINAEEGAPVKWVKPHPILAAVACKEKETKTQIKPQ